MYAMDHSTRNLKVFFFLEMQMYGVQTRSLIASIATQIDVRVLAISEDLIYLASNYPSGVVEVCPAPTSTLFAPFTLKYVSIEAREKPKVV